MSYQRKSGLVTRDRGALIGLVVCLALVVTPALSQDKAEATSDSEERFSEEIFVEGSAGTAARSASIAAKVDVPLRLTPASVSVVTRALSTEQNSVTLTDALRNVSGVNVHTNAGVNDFFLIRGFDSLSGGLVLTDGVAEPEATFYQLYNVERVEVLKGPGGFLYGGNPLAGTVNLLRVKPASRKFWRAGVGAGSYDTVRGRFDVNFADNDGRARFRLNGMAHDSEGYRDDKDNNSFALNPVLDLSLGRSGELRFDVEVMENEYSPDVGLPISGAMSFDLPRKRSYQSPFDFSVQDVTRLRVDWESMIGGSLSLHNKVYSSELDWRSDGTIFNGVFPIQTGDLFLFRILIPLDDRQLFIGDQFEAELTTMKHSWLFGLEITERRDEFQIDVTGLPPISLFDPVETATSPGPPIPGFSQFGDSRRQVIAPYFLDRVQVSDQFQVFWGARLDMMEFEDRFAGVVRDDDEVSPLLGLVYSPSPRVATYLNLGRSFSPPSTRASGELEPEESEQIEIGLKGDITRRMQGSLSLYHLERQNMAIFDDNGFTAQIGTQRSQGVEAELAGAIGGLHYQLACSYNDSELVEFNELLLIPPFFTPLLLDRSGNDPAFAPRDTWNFWIAKTFANGIGVGGGGRYVGSHFIAEDNVFKVEDALSFDASVFWDRDQWRLALNLKNITDEEYDTRGFGSTSVIPAAGTSVFVSLDFRQ